MDNFNLEIIALLIIKKGGIFKSIYHLHKILERKYRVFPAFELLDSICDKGWAIAEVIKQIHYYTVTEEGLRQIDNSKDKVIEEIIRAFPNEVEFTSLLISN